VEGYSGHVGVAGFSDGSDSTDAGVVGVGGRYGVSGLGGPDGDGVFGLTAVNFRSGVYGLHGADGVGFGVAGRTFSSNPDAAGAYGHAPDGMATGVIGYSAGGAGVKGVSSNATGVRGEALGGDSINDVGVSGSGHGPNGRGVIATAEGGIAMLGASTDGPGLYSASSNGPGAILRSDNQIAVYAYTGNPAGYALVTGGDNVYGDIYVNGQIMATGGCCSNITTTAGVREVYAIEGMRSLLSDQGTAQLVDGRAVITIDPLFAQAVNLNEKYQVFLTPHSAGTLGLAAINLTARSFEVRELNKGQGNFEFSWRIDAVRNGYEQVRLAPAPPALAAAPVPEMPVIGPPPAAPAMPVMDPPPAVPPMPDK
jgi:hypothetical protein